MSEIVAIRDEQRTIKQEPGSNAGLETCGELSLPVSVVDALAV